MQAQGLPFDVSAIAAAAQEAGNDAFWAVHDFFFTNEGQALIKGPKEATREKVEKILQQKGYDLKAFQTALENGRGKQRVEEDLATGRKIHVRGTPTTLLNGQFLLSPLTDKVVESFLGK